MNDILTGPADPDAFRVRVGRKRFYTDSLPGCPIAGESDQTYPSVSAVKKASGADWSSVTLRRVSNADPRELATLPDLPTGRRFDAMNSIARHGLSIDAGRGTIIHWWGEDLLHGHAPRDLTLSDLAANDIPAESLEIASKYRAALVDFFEAYQPRLIATEYVVIQRDLHGTGWGCTPDGLWMLDNPPRGVSVGPWAFDYKTRGLTSNHGAYPEEAAQIAAGAHGDYMVVSDGSGGAVRQELPEVAGGMVVSIKPEGARVYPINLTHAYEHWTHLHRWYVARQTERDIVGRPWAVRRAPSATPPAESDLETSIRQATSREELEDLWRRNAARWSGSLTQQAHARINDLARSE